MSEDKKRDRALQRRVRERQAKTGESYQAAWQQLADQKEPEQLFSRSSTGLPPLDNVLGGGLVSASVVLFAGPVGSGRTSLTLQMLKGLGHRCLHVTSEDTWEQAAANAQRVGAVSDQISLMAERNVAKILAYAQEIQAKTIAIDTIQKIRCDDIEGKAGSPKQLVESVNRLVDYAKTNDTAIWIVGHVTSAGAIAGPTAIEHSVDVVLTIELGTYFEGRERIVRGSGKNRFGPSNLVRSFELTNEGFIPAGAGFQGASDDNKAPAAPASTQLRVDRTPSRLPLSFSTVDKIPPGQPFQITARPQLESFWPDRLLIKNADRWDVHRLAVGLGKSPWSSLIEEIEDGPHRRRASVFSLDTWHPLIRREVSIGEPIVLVVTYTGPNEQGENFEAALFGWDDYPPDKPSDHHETANSKRVSERAESKSVNPEEMVVLPMTIASPTLFVDHFTIVDAKDWIVHDIRTHGKSIFVESGDLPGEMFSGSAPVILKPLAAKDRVEIAATYVGNKTASRLMIELSGTAKPTSHQRDVSYFLPLSTDVPILPTQSAQITRQSRRNFIPDRLVITDPDSWIVNDIKVGNRCQTARSGDLPGQTFSIRAVGCAVTFERVQKGMDFLIVTTRGDGGNEEGAGFYGGVQGRLVQEL